MVFGKERGMNAEVDFLAVGRLDSGEKFEGVAETGSEFEVEALYGAYAFDVDLFFLSPEAVGEGSKDDGFVGGVVAIDVESFICFGVAEAFGFGEGSGVVEVMGFHAGEDVVTGAVDDAVDGEDFIGGEAVLEGFDDGDGAGDAGFEEEVALLVSSEGEEFLAVSCEERFIGGDDVFVVMEGSFDEGVGRFDTAKEFDEDIGMGIVGEGEEIGGEDFWGGALSFSFGEVANSDFADLELGMSALGKKFSMLAEMIPEGGANGAKAG